MSDDKLAPSAEERTGYNLDALAEEICPHAGFSETRDRAKEVLRRVIGGGTRSSEPASFGDEMRAKGFAEVPSRAERFVASEDERWIVVKEHAVDVGEVRPKLGYIFVFEWPSFGTPEEAHAFIKERQLPLGWVLTKASSLRLEDRTKPVASAIELIPMSKGWVEAAKCPECDGSGFNVRQFAAGEFEQVQCQWCDERHHAVHAADRTGGTNGKA